MKCLLSSLIFIVIFTACKSKNSEEIKKAARDTTAITIDTFSTNSTPDLRSIGDLKLDMSDSAISAILGTPDSKSKPIEWEADGLYHQDWKYAQKGLELGIAADNKDMKKSSLFSIILTDKSTWQTDRKIGIGNSYDDVKKTYEKWMDKEMTDSVTITVGSVYDGMIFNFSQGKVNRIFVGAAAE